MFGLNSYATFKSSKTLLLRVRNFRMIFVSERLSKCEVIFLAYVRKGPLLLFFARSSKITINSSSSPIEYGPVDTQIDPQSRPVCARPYFMFEYARTLALSYVMLTSASCSRGNRVPSKCRSRCEEIIDPNPKICLSVAHVCISGVKNSAVLFRTVPVQYLYWPTRKMKLREI